ncbi:hypothetical protein BGZ63DRAFT_324259, partial [Mariannaea sp. PMI_226]
VEKMLRTPYGQVYQLSRDQLTYMKPRDLDGTPIARLRESDPYWESGWASLDRFLDREAEEERLKREYRAEQLRKPDDKAVAKACRRHRDNVSKHRKIREIFGHNTPYHPNQLVAKENLPLGGLVEMDVMYKMACKITDLRALQAHGKLAMDPWDFLRWRVIKKARESCVFPWEKLGDVIKSIVLRIGDDSGLDGAERFEDSLFRKAILEAAKIQCTLNRYGAKKVHKPSPSFSESLVPRVGPVSPLPPPPPTFNRTSGPADPEPAREQNERSQRETTRSERRQAEANRTPIYQGVNAYRAQMEQRR